MGVGEWKMGVGKGEDGGGGGEDGSGGRGRREESKRNIKVALNRERQRESARRREDRIQLQVETAREYTASAFLR